MKHRVFDEAQEKVWILYIGDYRECEWRRLVPLMQISLLIDIPGYQFK
jgi:hypothetical protein